MRRAGPLSVNQVLDNCKTIKPDDRRRCLITVRRDTGVEPIGCKRASGMVPRTVDLQTTGTRVGQPTTAASSNSTSTTAGKGSRPRWPCRR